MKNKNLYLISLGCNKNLVDSEVMLAKLSDYTVCANPEDADVIIINSCGFIGDAKEESIQTAIQMSQIKKEDCVLVMSGCLSERYKEELLDEFHEVDLFTGVGDYDKIDEIIESKQNRFSDKVYLIDGEERVITGSLYHAYVKISEGCNQTCSFCAIPSFKGKLQSRSVDSVVKEVKSLVEKGFFDFTFISQDSSSYLKDKGIKDGLIDLIDEIEKIDGVKSARILYLYPSTTSLEMIRRVHKSPLFSNYFDMPLQHINQNMLKVMKRGKGSDKIKELLECMREKESFIRTSFIVGHPKETNEEFDEMVQFAQNFKFDRLNIFAYSDEEETLSCNMVDDKIPDEVISNRLDVIEEVVAQVLEEKEQEQIGKIIDIVIDGESDEHEYLLSAKSTLWAPDIDGQIYVNDTKIENLEYQTKIYQAKINEVVNGIFLVEVIKEKED
jgi:ribosomal protein S12 methylthiotransferase RimO